MASLHDKLHQLEEATATSHNLLLEKETKLAAASATLDAAKDKLRSLNPEAQADLQVNDTELPELLEAKMIAQGEYDEAKKRYETNQRYVAVLREKLAKANNT
ncbi:hypothetical protein HJC23_004175 [Cyclotella cryptica]|uniref:Uncharacterized protein n=1 Tax=Cyclotella cryptica TaxID=29204 RepID=A0ABD3Q881_9STRA|eukprot:CCRYP_007807-RA/>CCRYP_007807-RA protein AED:0.06 eAED:-0.01 QI:0/-1/0/1/-1/1/1/0/102